LNKGRELYLPRKKPGTRKGGGNEGQLLKYPAHLRRGRFTKGGTFSVRARTYGRVLEKGFGIELPKRGRGESQKEGY